MGFFWIALAVSAQLGATPLVWDANTGASGPNDGAGTWTDGGNNWWDPAAGGGAGAQANWSNANPDAATFGVGSGGTTAYTVTLGSAITASAVTFQNQVYTIGGANLLTLSGTPTVTANVDGTISANLGGNAGMTKSGAAMLSLTGNVNYTGGTSVNQGTLRLARTTVAFPGGGATGQFGSAHTVTVNSGATLQVNGNWVLGDGLTNQIVVNGGTLQFLDSDNYMGNIALTGGAITATGASRPWRTGNWGNALVTVNPSASSSTIQGTLFFVGTPTATKTTFHVADGAAAEDLVMSSTISDHPGFEGKMKLVKDGAGLMSLTGLVNSTGGVTVDGGILRLARTGYGSPSSGGQLGSGQTVTVNSGATLQLNKDWVIGDGVANQVVVNGGTLQFLDSDNYLSRITLTGGAITTSGGIRPWRIGNYGDGLITVNASATSSTIQGSLCFVKIGSATKTTFDVADGAAADDLVVSSTIFDHPGAYNGMALVKTGLGRMVLSGNNTFDGGIVLSQGTLVGDDQNNAFSSAGAVTVGDANSGANNLALFLDPTTGGDQFMARPITVTSNGAAVTIGTSRSGAGRAFFDGLLTINKDVTLQGTLADRTQYRGGITGTGNITIAGGSRTTWSTTTATTEGGDDASPYNFTGNVSIVGSGTMLQTNSHNVIPDSSNVDVGAGATFRMAYGKNETINQLTGSGTVASVAGNSTLTVQGGNFSGLVTDGAGDGGDLLSLTKTGPGTLTLSNAANNFDGVVRINGGVLSINSLAGGNTACALGAMYGTAGYLIFDGGTLQYTGSTVAGINRAFTVNAGGGTLDIANAATSVTWTDASGAGPIVGTGMLTKEGPGTLVLASANTYSGGTKVNAGTLAIGNVNSLGTGSATVESGATLDLGAANVANAITLNGGTLWTANGASGTITLNNAAGNTINASGNYRILSGKITGAGGFTLGGAGTPGLQLTNPANDFQGNVTINAGAYLRLTASEVVPDIATVTVNGHLRLEGGGLTETIAGLNGNGSVWIPLSSNNHTLRVGYNDTSSSFAGSLIPPGQSPTLSLEKIGAGTLALGGSSLYNGTTTVSGGRLLVNGTHTGGGLYTVAAGATLGGTGSITAPVDLFGRMSPGASVESLATGSETWHDGGRFRFEIDDAAGTAGAAPGWDLLQVNGQLDLSALGAAGFTIEVASLLPGGGTNPGDAANFAADAGASYRWDFVETTTGIVGFDAADFAFDTSAFSNLISNGFGNGRFGILQDGNVLALTFTASVPEPSTLALAAMALVVALIPLCRRMTVPAAKKIGE